MKVLKLGFLLGTALGVVLLFSPAPSSATAKYAKDTKKKCTDCHTKIPKKGDKDPLLNEFGRKFAENDHKLPK
jgi:hypothetical protein